MIHLSRIRFTPASERDVQRGLLGWVACRCGALDLDGLALRRTARGTLAISFPERRDGRGRAHPYIAPVDLEARRALEDQVLRALRERGEVAP